MGTKALVALVVVVVWTCVIGVLIQSGSSNTRPLGKSPPIAGSSRSTDSSQSPATVRWSPPKEKTRDDLLRDWVTRRFATRRLKYDELAIDSAVQKLSSGRSDPLPATGVLSRGDRRLGVAPLTIQTLAGSNYYIRVLDWTTKAEVINAFIRGGEQLVTKVPLGQYEIRYAAGQEWYGPTLDFGDGALYFRCDDQFAFTQTNDVYSGYAIELILQEGGNLQTENISDTEF